MINPQIRHIALDDGNGKAYRPKLRKLKLICRNLPADTQIIGFGHYGFTDMFYLIAHSQAFPINIPYTISVKSLLRGGLAPAFAPNSPA